MNRALAVGVITAFLTLVVGFARAGDSVDVTALKDAKYFAFGGIGYAGTTSPGELAFRRIVAKASAKTEMVAVFASGNPQGKCYAIVGLKLLDRPAFDQCSGKLGKSVGSVNTISGCIIGKKSMAALVSEIRAGAYDRQATVPLHSPRN